MAPPTRDPGVLTVEVTGRRPRPQGSMRKGPTGKITHSDPQYRLWREHVVKVTTAAAKDAGFQTLASGVRVEVQFRFLRPKQAIPERRLVPFSSETPDIDKVTRGVLDALQGGKVILNDCQVVILAASKVFVDAREAEGFSLRLEPANRTDLAAWPTEQGWG